MADMGSNFNLDLLMYMLGGMAGPVASGKEGAWQAALGGMAQQQMSAKSARDVLGKLLAGAAENGSEIKLGEDGMTMKVPTSAFGKQEQQKKQLGDLGLTGQVATPAEGGSGTNWNMNNLPGNTLDAFVRAGLLGNPR